MYRSFGIMGCMLFTFEGASMESHFSFPLMNKSNKTEVVIFPIKLCLLRTVPFLR